MDVALRFRCTACGNCCRSLRVAVTWQDVRRLSEASGLRPELLVEWLRPDEVDMSGEPESFVELSQGRRLMVLSQRDGACRLLGADNRCGQYAARPQDCRLFPFNPSYAPAAPQRLTRLELLPLQGCDYALDGDNDVAHLCEADSIRWRELRSYQAGVARWNQLARRRRRFGYPIGAPPAFFEFLSEA